MTKQKQMTEKELDQVSGGPHYSDFNGRTGVMEKRSKRKLRCQLSNVCNITEELFGGYN